MMTITNNQLNSIIQDAEANLDIGGNILLRAKVTDDMERPENFEAAINYGRAQIYNDSLWEAVSNDIQEFAEENQMDSENAVDGFFSFQEITINPEMTLIRMISYQPHIMVQGPYLLYEFNVTPEQTKQFLKHILLIWPFLDNRNFYVNYNNVRRTREHIVELYVQETRMR